MSFLESHLILPFAANFFFLEIFATFLLSLHILLKKQDPHVCLGWLLSTALFPLTTGIFYLSFGINPFHQYAERKRRSKALARISRSRGQRQEMIGSSKTLCYERGFSGFESTVEWISQVTGQALSCQNSIEMFVNSNAVYKEVNACIDTAEKFILVQFYQIQADEIGLGFLDLLVKKAKSGVRVYVLFDALGSFTLNSELVAKYRSQGLDIRRFLEIHPIKRRFQINWRNHRKLIVVDGKTAFAGGFNMGKLYLEGSNPDRAIWVDLIFKVQGKIISDLTTHFLEDWHFTTGRMLSSVTLDESPVPIKSESSLMAVVSSGPSEPIASFYSTLQHILFEARSRVWMMTPYFVPDKALLHAMRLAVARGVDVKVVVPLRSNHPFTDMCASSYFAEFAQFGIDLLRYKYGVCHGKIILADEDLVFSGSSNLDYRSFFLNFETDLFIRDKRLAGEVEIFLKDIMTKSIPLSRRDYTGIRFERLILRRMMRLFAPLM